MAFLSATLDRVKPSPTIAVTTKAAELKAAGRDIIGLGAGEPDFDTPDNIKAAAVQAIAEGKTKYTAVDGIPELKQAICAKFKRDNALTYDPAQVTVGTGGKQVLYNAFMATLNAGDEVIIPAPYWVSYPEMVKLAGATPKMVLADDSTHFKLTPAMLEAAITPRTRLLVMNSPSNPTGVVYTRDELAAITAVAVAHNLYILSDEMYEHLLYDGAQATCIATLSKEAEARTIVVAGFSKTYAMTGWRLGTLVAPAPIVKACTELQSQMSSNATTFAQWGAVAALKEKEKTAASLAMMMTAFDRRRKFLHTELNKIPGMTCLLSQGAFYLFPKITAFGLPDEEFCAKLLEEEKVAAVPGSAFGAPGYLRLSYATSDEIIRKGVERLARFCAKLKK